MKNKILLFLLAVVVFPFSSCNDELELFPHDGVAVDLGFQNLTDFENATRGVYAGFRSDGYYGASSAAASIYFIPDVISDDVIINSAGRRSRETFYDWRYDEDNSSQTFWAAGYKVIQRANLILEKIDALEASPEKDNYRGEALAARGIAHFDLAKLYADSPANASGSLGVPFVTSTDASLTPARNTLDETYTNILADLNSAYDLINADNGRGRLNKNAVAGLLSRVHLFRGDYDAVLTNTDRVTGVSETPRSSVFNMWKDADESSVLWKLITTEPDDVTIGVAWMQESPDGIRSEYNVDYALYQMYSDDDIRKEVYFETSAFNGVDYNHIVKFRGRLSGNANEVDAKALRYSEVLLNKAEAHAEKSQDGMALTALDELRSNRYANFVSGNETGQALKDAIALERRLELAFEGQRFFDLKRKGLPITRSSFGDQADGTGIPAEFMTLPANDHKFNMAIGDSERNANANMEQNAGY